MVLIQSEPCTYIHSSRQMFHKDFSPTAFNLHRAAQVEAGMASTFPWTVLVMLSSDGWLYILLKDMTIVKVYVPQGVAVLFRGDVLHAGAAYQHWHMRAHWYLVPKVPGNLGLRTADDWRQNEDGDVALHDEDPFEEWSEQSSKVEPTVPSSVVIHVPSECDILTMDSLVTGPSAQLVKC